MSFGLKNAEATFQRMVNKVFKELIRHTMEVYVDDMLVKSLRCTDHVQHLSEAFDGLQKYKVFDAPSVWNLGKFLGYLVIQRGMEANPDLISAILG